MPKLLQSTGMGSSWARFWSPFYLLHFLLSAFYPIVRVLHVKQGLRILGPYSWLKTGYELTNWERQAACTLVIMVAWKYLRRHSPDHCFASSVFLIELVGLLLTYLVDMRLFAWYLFLKWLVFALYPQPSWEGADNIERLTPITFKESAQNPGGNAAWVVMFYSTWSSACAQMSPVFAELSRRYGSDRLKFGSLDVGAWPSTAKELKIEVSSISDQLPSIFLFEKGQPQSRFPAENFSGRIYYNKRELVKKFQLDSKAVKPAEKKREKPH